MADQNITELPVKTSSGITSSDYMLGIDSAEGYQMLIRDLGDYIIRNVQVNTIAGSNQTLKNALDALNSKLILSNNSINALPTNPTEGVFFVNNSQNNDFPSNFGLFEVKKVSPNNLTEYVGVFYGTANSGVRRIYMNYYHANLSGWQGWFTPANQSDVDAINSKTAYAIYNLKDYLIRTDQSTDTIGRIAVFGNVVMVSMQLGGLSLSVGENDIGSLSSFYPSWISSSSGDIFAVGTHGSASIVGNLVRLHLKSNGNISVVASTAQTSTLRVTFTYATSL